MYVYDASSCLLAQDSPATDTFVTTSTSARPTTEGAPAECSAPTRPARVVAERARQVEPLVTPPLRPFVIVLTREFPTFNLRILFLRSLFNAIFLHVNIIAMTVA